MAVGGLKKRRKLSPSSAVSKRMEVGSERVPIFCTRTTRTETGRPRPRRARVCLGLGVRAPRRDPDAGGGRCGWRRVVSCRVSGALHLHAPAVHSMCGAVCLCVQAVLHVLLLLI
jgi:hypothetical protein